MSIDYRYNYGIDIGPGDSHRDRRWVWYLIRDYNDPYSDDSWQVDGKRYRATRASGRGPGFDTIEEARAYVHAGVLKDLEIDKATLLKRVAAINEAIASLGDDPAQLERFAKERDWSPAKANTEAYRASH